MIRSQSASASKSSVGLSSPIALLDLLGGQLALGRAGLVILAHHAGAAVERLLAHLDDRHRDAGRQEVHRDAAAHGARADHADALDVARRGAFGQAVDLGRLALGEEEILLRPGLGAAHQLHEQFALFEHAFGIGLLGRDAHRLDILRGASKPRNLRPLALRNSSNTAGSTPVDLVLPLRRFGQRPDVAHFLGISRPRAAPARPRSAGRPGRSRTLPWR